jgi:periplasmic divalent cation tolerance protein
MADYLQVSTTADSRDVAMDLLRSAVQARLAASGQVFGPAASVFWHEGELGEGEEWQVFLRTTTDRYPRAGGTPQIPAPVGKPRGLVHGD